MKKIKKLKATALILAGIFVLLSLAGCGGTKDRDNEKTDILCTTFAEYCWVKNIVTLADGTSNVRVSLLIKNGQELHGYDPSPSEMIEIKMSDVLISVGGVSDEWITEAIKDTDTLHVKLSKIEGMTHHLVSETSDAHGEHDHSGDHTHTHGEIDEHLWLSPKNAITACEYLLELICELDEENSQKYKENAKAYIDRLEILDKLLTDLANGALKEKTLIFADRFPFVYMLADYGIDYYAAFKGCDTESAWTAQTALELAKRIESTGSETVFVTENSDGELARIAIGNLGGKEIEIVKLNSMQSITFDASRDTDYIEIMLENIAAIERSFAKN